MPSTPPIPADADESYRYDAFISYRHVDPDRKWAKWLHVSLETYRVPRDVVRIRAVPPRLKRVFRDEEELPASSDLNREIETALRESRFLIVVCSPRTPASEWVNKEVLRFREMGRDDRILALLIEGEPADAFPQALREIRRRIVDEAGLEREQIEEVEPLAADIRPSRHESQGHLVRMAKLRILACLLGLRFDDLRQREQERQARRLARIGIAASLLVLIMAALTAFALAQRHTARVNEKAATANAARADANAATADANARRAMEGERNTKLKLAELLVARGDDFHREGRVVEARQLYWSGFDSFTAIHASPLRAEISLCDAYSASEPPLLTLDGHAGWVSGVAFTPDGRSALSSSWDMSIRQWDLLTGRQIRSSVRPYAQALAIACSPDGRNALAVGVDGVLRLWDLSTGAEIRTMQGQVGTARSLSFSRDGNAALVPGPKNTMVLWNLQTGKEIRRFSGHTDEVQSVAFSPDGLTALSSSADRTLKLWDVQTANEIRTFRGHEDLVGAAAFSPDGKTVLSASNDNTLRLWDVQTGNTLRTFAGHADWVLSVAFTPDGHAALSGGKDRTLKLWDIQTGNLLRTFHGHTDEVLSVAISPDGRTALSGSKDKTLQLWNLDSDAESHVLNKNDGAVNEVAFGAGGRLALTRSGRSPRIYDLATGNLLAADASFGDVVGISPDGRTLISQADDKMVRVMDIATRKPIRRLSEIVDTIHAAAFSADGVKLLTFNGGNELKLWNLITGALIHTLPCKPYGITCIAVSADGRAALSGASDAKLTLWDLQIGKEVRTLERMGHAIACVAFSPDGRSALTGGFDNAITQWDLQTGNVIHVLQGHKAMVSGVTYSPEGRSAASVSYDFTVKLWDLETGGEIRTLQRHTSQALSVAFNPNGDAILSGSNDRTAIYWDFSRVARYRAFGSLLPKARHGLAATIDDAESLGTLGNWWAFRGKDDWAIELLEKARAGGIFIDPLTLARCYWKLANELPPKCALTRDACLDHARREYTASLAASKTPADRYYPRLCLDSLARSAR